MKLCWQGLDKWASEKQIAKFISSLFTDTSGISLWKAPKKTYAFLSFDSQGKLDEFVGTISDKTYQNKKIKLKPSLGDKKHAKFHTISSLLVDKARTITREAQPLGPIELKVTPLYQIPYSDQLIEKQRTVQNCYDSFLKEMNNYIQKQSLIEFTWMRSPPEVKEIIPSPVLEHYRNKIEFTIGYNEEQMLSVGFNNGQMSAGTIRTDSPENCINIPTRVKEIGLFIQNLLKESGIPPVDPKNGEGVWKQAVIRVSNYNPSTMLVIHIRPTEDIERIKSILSGIEGQVDTCSLCIDSHPPEVHSIFGPGHITESLLGKSFKISPLSFFQVNTLACEVLLRQVKDLIEGEVLLDVCCGTGSIGIACSDNLKVIGIEIVPEAIEDAKVNAQINGTQAEYHAGKAEVLMKDICGRIENSVITGVVDPPRSGLHKDVLKALRTTRGLNNLVYVSCNPASLFKNLFDLCVPENKRIRGPPFYIVSIQPVDMFPHTPHVECVVNLKRL